MLPDYATDERRWLAVERRDSAADQHFVFAVKTTGIFCRPSCRARHPLRQNVIFYPDARAAQAAGFRPCKRCQPDRAPEARRQAQIALACRLLEESETPLSLAALADRVAVSPWHFHRLFKQATGMTPKAWQQARRAARLRGALQQGETVTDALLTAGYPSAGSYYRQADRALGMTARQYRGRGASLTIQFVIGRCQLGGFLVACGERGVCAILLGDDAQSLIGQLESLFPQARLEPGEHVLGEHIARIVGFLESRESAFPLPLDLQGTAFQQRVWQALQTIPPGKTASYQDIARLVGNPAAVRAVAGACAANKLAVAIPCHRIVRQDGSLSGYRWGVERKRKLLAREQGEEEG
ncbi:bifunctional DNA-binding transcriptional regulator/O6-methylguanine-DNA methyltransferase Ada [Entomohabitans teleogrylli]|uniref:bifunctional DNA-binding transcriptional regulator/O6-methylguanine-DNA methyltransferase Ada n=1 Tax=Entomohabitans teleogrylli TaxID=1384589 RepID=UPI00073DAC6E|nr:bifunctional DNA-binding transcriptional regulator/O6-methylguanine-DNA methyltransferase Ada [Entomohabitans teleogrylli]